MDQLTIHRRYCWDFREKAWSVFLRNLIEFGIAYRISWNLSKLNHAAENYNDVSQEKLNSFFVTSLT